MDRVTRRRVERLLRIGAVLSIGIVLAVTLRRASLSGILRVLASANVPLLVVLVPSILAVSFVLRAARFRALLSGACRSDFRFRDVLASVLVSQAANNVLPFRAGELVRTRDFVVRGCPFSKVASAQVMEKLIELAALLAWTAPVVGRELFVRRPALACGLVLLVVVATAFWMVRTMRRTEDAAELFVRLRGGLGELARASGWALLADGCEVALIYVCLRSLGIAGGFGTSLTVLAAVNIAIALPSTPGQLGALEAGAALGLIMVGISREPALAFALLYRFVQWVPVTFAGGIVWWLRRPPGDAPLAGSSIAGRSEVGP